MNREHNGSCHCGAVTFKVRFDIANGTSKCNCSLCWKQRNWNIPGLKPDDFELVSGHDQLADYGKSGDGFEIHHRFCKVCGTATHGHGHIEQAGGAFVSVRIAALDDLGIEDLVSAPTTYCDGRNDNWWNPPADTRLL